MLAAVAANPAGRPAARRRRAAIAVALAAATAAGTAGCAKFDQAMGQQEEVVIFQANTPSAVKLKVRTACSHIPNVVVEPLPTDHKLSDEVYNVRYEVGTASTTELAQLQQCLTRFSSVVGLETDTPGGDD
jgi:hypothetical protein